MGVGQGDAALDLRPAPRQVGACPVRPRRRDSGREAPAVTEQHHDWAEGRRYLGLDVLARSRNALINTHETIMENEDLTRAALTAAGLSTMSPVLFHASRTATSS